MSDRVSRGHGGGQTKPPCVAGGKELELDRRMGRQVCHRLAVRQDWSTGSLSLVAQSDSGELASDEQSVKANEFVK